jgi:adenosylhomocysteine nucleosidase
MIVICVAMPEEARIFRSILRSAHPSPTVPPLQIWTTGVGPELAERNFSRYIESASSSPKAVVISGFAGGLNPSLRSGDLVLHGNYDEFPRVDRFSHECLIRGKYLTSNKIITSAQEKQVLFDSTQHDAVDMESSVLLDKCQSYGIPGIVLKAISDAAHEDLPLDFSQFLGNSGRMNYFQLAMSIARKPTVLPSLMDLGSRSSLCGHNLRSAFHPWWTSFSSQS